MQIDRSMANSNIDVVVQEKNAVTPVASRIPEDSIKLLHELENVRSLSSIIIGSTRTPGLPYVFLFGISSQAPYLSVTNWLGTGLIEGSMLRPGKKEVMIGRSAARRLKKETGDTLELGSKELFTISGVYWLGQGVLDGGVVIDIEGSQGLLKRQGYVNLALIEGKPSKNRHSDPRNPGSISKSESGTGKFPAHSNSCYYHDRRICCRSFGDIPSFKWRTDSKHPDNGHLRKDKGNRHTDGHWLVKGDDHGVNCHRGCSTGYGGGILGFVSAFPALRLLTFLPTMALGWVPVVPSLNLFFWAVGLASGIAGLSALYPALFATRLMPAEALRFE